MKNVAVIGCGTMGNGIAHLFSQYGFSVQLVDINKDILAYCENYLSITNLLTNLLRRLSEENGTFLGTLEINLQGITDPSYIFNL